MSNQYTLRRLAREYPLHALAGPSIEAAAALDSRDAEIVRLKLTLIGVSRTLKHNAPITAEWADKAIADITSAFTGDPS